MEQGYFVWMWNHQHSNNNMLNLELCTRNFLIPVLQLEMVVITFHTHVYVVIKTGQNSQNEISPMKAGGEKGKTFLQAKCSR